MHPIIHNIFYMYLLKKKKIREVKRTFNTRLMIGPEP